MEYILAIWLHGQSTPIYPVDRHLTKTECARAASEAIRLHGEVVAKAKCEPAK